MENTKMQPELSIIIPTYNHCEDLLKPCIQSIIKYTDLSDKEVIIVANGCTDNTKHYVNSLGSPFKLIWVDEQLGYTKATNMGIRSSSGKYIVLLNNDTLLLEQEKDVWIELLKKPFADPDMAASGPVLMHDKFSDRDFIIFFCVMIKQEIFETIGLLDESFSPGGGEDTEFCIRMQNYGYKIAEPDQHVFNGATNTGPIPIYHIGEGTFNHIPEYGAVIIKKNSLALAKRFNKNIKLNLGCGPIAIPGYFGVDLKDPHADILMDVAKLDFEDNTVSEMIASHLFEHLNPYKVEDILRDWFRALKPEGRLIMEMPDIEKLCEAFAKVPLGERWGLLNCIYGSVNTHGGDPSEITSSHLFGWYPENILGILQNVGFTEIEFKPEQIPHPGFNFRVECKKPTPKKIEKPEIKVQDAKTVSAEISTKGRYETTLPLAIMAIAHQTHVPNELIIFDDDEHRDLRTHTLYGPIFNLLQQRGIAWRYIFGEKKGQTLNHQKAIELSPNALIWRVDDDDSPETNVLEQLLSNMAPEVGAIGSLIRVPGDRIFSEAICSGCIEDIYTLPNIQWSDFKGLKESDHLNNSFLFRRSSKYEYDTSLSPVGHREETIFSYRIKRAGFKVLVDGDCTTWHMKSPSGGIRSFSDSKLWAGDDAIFEKHMKSWGVSPKSYKIAALDCGLGDHFVFKEILPEIKDRHKNIILAVCYPDVFEKNPDIRIVSLADAASLVGNLDNYNIYRFCIDHNWDRSLGEAFKAMYL